MKLTRARLALATAFLGLVLYPSLLGPGDVPIPPGARSADPSPIAVASQGGVGASDDPQALCQARIDDVLRLPAHPGACVSAECRLELFMAVKAEPPVSLILFDRVGIGPAPPPPMHRDMRALRDRLGFDRLRLVHLTPRRSVVELRYCAHWVPTLLDSYGAQFRVLCELVPRGAEAAIETVRNAAAQRRVVWRSLQNAITTQIDEELPFDEPRYEIGRFEFCPFGRVELRRVPELVDHARARPDAFEVLDIEESVALGDAAQLRAYLRDHADDLAPGDMLFIGGYVPWEPRRLVHYHSFFLFECDPLTGLPLSLAGNAGHPSLRTWSKEGGRTPKRTLRFRVRPTTAWLELSVNPTTPSELEIPLFLALGGSG